MNVTKTGCAYAVVSLSGEVVFCSVNRSASFRFQSAYNQLVRKADRLKLRKVHYLPT